MPHQVFVSHATEDLDTARRVCKIVEADGVSCWLATRDVKAGTDYAAAILDAIKNSQLVLLIFSKHANASPYVLREIERAIAYNRPVLSLRIDDAVPNASMEYYLNLWQWLDVAAGVEKKRREIVAAVRKQLERGTEPEESADERSEAGALQQVGTTHRRTRRTWGIVIAAVLLIAAAAGAGTWAATRHSGAQASSSTLGTNTAAGTASSTTPSTTAASGTPSSNIALSPNTWTQLSPSGEVPIGRTQQSMAYDSSSGRVIMFGGYYADVNPLNETWAYDPVADTWTNVNPSGTLPPARFCQSMVYDPSTHHVIMFGGSNGTDQLNDTWAYDPSANTWTNLNPSGALPAGRWGLSLVYDPSGRRVIMFGGQPSGDNFLNDTWAYDPVTNTWTNLSPKGTLPVARFCQSLAYDSATGKVIMFGGTGDSGDLNDTWAYDPVANTWSELSPTGTLPYSRYASSMVFSSSDGVVILFGGAYGNGAGLFGDTWVYSPATNAWTIPTGSGEIPPMRAFQSMVYDSTTHQVIMFGGSGGSGDFNDTWDYTP